MTQSEGGGVMRGWGERGRAWDTTSCPSLVDMHVCVGVCVSVCKGTVSRDLRFMDFTLTGSALSRI